MIQDFLNEITFQLSSRYPLIYMEIYNQITGNEFLKLKLFNDDKKTNLLIEKYGFREEFMSGRDN